MSHIENSPSEKNRAWPPTTASAAGTKNWTAGQEAATLRARIPAPDDALEEGVVLLGRALADLEDREVS